jgi:hypothetical protein
VAERSIGAEAENADGLLRMLLDFGQHLAERQSTAPEVE